MDGFHVLSRATIERELASVAHRWSAPPSSTEEFTAWGWVVASVCDTFATENLGACRELLEAETASLSRIIEERQRLVPGAPPPELLQKQAFLAFLGHEVMVGLGVAA
jgi:hypothetical protein